MAATDSTVNSKPGSEKKPGADQPADKKAADDAAALAKKLYDDSHPAAAKPVSKPAAPEAAQSASGFMGWLSDTEKSASAALSNAASSLKQEAKADLKTISAIASGVAAKGDSVVAQFGALTISGIEGPNDAKQAAGNKSKPADKKVSDGSTNKSSTELAGAANKQAQSEKQAVPAAPADASAPATKDASGTAAPAPASDATVGSGLLSSITDVVGSVASYVGSTVKSTLDSVMSKETEDALLNAAELYGPAALAMGGVVGVAGMAGMAVAGVAVAGAAEASLAKAPLPAMVGMAGTAYKNYLNDFKDGEFDKSAQHVTSFDNVNFASLDKAASADTLATQKSDDELLAKSATWFIAGDSNPGGAASIARTGNETTAKGTTKDNIAYSVKSSPEEQSAQVGAILADHKANGDVTIGNVDFTMTVKPPLTTLESKDKQQTITYDANTHVRTLLDKKVGYKITQNADGGIVTEQNGKAYLQAPAGATIVKAMQDAAKSAGSKIIFATDDNGDKGAFGQDGTSYVLLAKSHQLVVTKDGFKLVLDTLHAKAQLYELDPKTKQFVLTKPDPKTLPPGWVINGDSVQINGQSLKNKGELVFHVLGAVFDPEKTKITDTTKAGDVVLSSDSTGTHLDGAGGPKVDKTLTGKVTIESPGEAPVVFDQNGISVKSTDGTVASIEASGAAKLVDGKTHQEADIDPRGNETSYNAKHQQIFSMNSQGDMRLPDGTTVYHTGAVYNPSRIYEPSYNGKTAGEVIHDAVSLSSYVGGALGGSIASLESTLAMLDSLGDIPGLAEQIGAAKENIQVKIYEARGKEFLAATLAQAGKGSDTLEQGLAMRGSGLSDQDIANRLSKT
jgi:hypothetical protein